MLAGASLIWMLVVALAWHAMSRRRNGLHATGGRRLIVIGGLLLPTIVLMALLAYSAASSERITGDRQQVTHAIDVRARQWQWTFEYRDGIDGDILARSEDALLMPRGEWVEFRVHGEDVIHSFWIPRLGGKIDAIPGRINTIRLRADQGGRISGQCAEFCGLDHAHMRFDVHVVDPGEYAAWLRGDGSRFQPETVL